MTSLFQHSGVEGFVPKKETGALATYCANCDQRLEQHGSTWLTAQGSLRVCPRVEDREIPPERFQPEPEPPVPVQPMKAPFGTDHNQDSYARHVGKAMGNRGVEGHLIGASCESYNEDPERVAVPYQSYNHGHLRGAGLHNLKTTTPSIAVPCQRTNESHLRGASIITQKTEGVAQNYPHH